MFLNVILLIGLKFGIVKLITCYLLRIQFPNLELVKGQKNVYIFISDLEVAAPLFLFVCPDNCDSESCHNNY